MIPDIAVMIFAFGAALMLYVITRDPSKPTPKFVQFAAILAIIAAAVCLADVIEQGKQIAKSMQSLQQP